MCIFNRKVASVAITRIFVAPTKDGRQICVYENTVYMDDYKAIYSHTSSSASKTKKPPGNAMILPFPHTTSSEKLGFVDLSSYRSSSCLSEIDEAWPKLAPPPPSRGPEKRAKLARPKAKLEVVKVGSYECSVAENLADIRRIDEAVFKLSANVDKLLAKYYPEGFGFVICKLTAGGKQHPIGFVHNLMKDGALFVPTRHQHGEEDEEPTAHWDHNIYSLNTDGKEGGRTPKEEMARLREKATEAGVKEARIEINEEFLGRFQAPLAPMHCIRRLTITGKAKNRDLIFTLSSPPATTASASSVPAATITTTDAV